MTAFRNKCGKYHTHWTHSSRDISSKTSSCISGCISGIYSPNHGLYITYNGSNNAIVGIQEHTYIVVIQYV